MYIILLKIGYFSSADFVTITGEFAKLTFYIKISKNRGFCFKPSCPKGRQIAHRYIFITFFLLLCDYVTFYLMTFILLLLLS